MRDVDQDRQSVSRFVSEHLRDRGFRELLTATGDDDSKPIVIALPSDPAKAMLDEVVAVGGVANVILPAANGVMIYAMWNTRSECEPAAADVDVLVEECTVGVFLARVREDGGKGKYTFAVSGPDSSHGQASLAGLAV